MHFSHAFVAILSIVGTQAAALPLGNAAAGPSGGASLNAVRSVGFGQGALPHAVERSAIDVLTARGMPSDVAEASFGVFARHANVKDDRERSILIARDLSKRGILDMLVQAISDLLTELLGTRKSKRDVERQLSTTLSTITGLDFSSKAKARQSWAQMLDSISSALEEQADLLKNGTSTNATSSANQKQVAAGTNATASASKNATTAALPDVTASASQNGTSASTPKASASVEGAIREAKTKTYQGNKAIERREESSLLEARQEGVQGLLEVLRQLVDAILNTLLPMNSRSSSDDSSDAPEPSGDCPAPGTPNDGMYRPGCPGYGRRAVTDMLLKVRDATSSADSLSSLIPLLQQLMQQLQAGESTATDAAAGAASTDATGSSAAQTAAEQSLNARSLLEADGFQLGKRQDNSLLAAILQLIESILGGLTDKDLDTPITNGTDATSAKKASKSNSNSSTSLLSALLGKRDGLDISLLNNLLGNLLSGDGASQSSDTTNNKRGINLSILNNLLGNLLGGDNSTQSADIDNGDGNEGGLTLSILNNVLGNLLGGTNAAQTSDVAKRDGLNLSLLNNVLGNLLSGDGASQSSDSSNDKRDGLNISLLNNLLGNLLSGDGASQSSDSTNNKRDGLNLSLLNNLLGNLLSGDNASQSSDSTNNKRDGLNLSLLNNLLGNLLSGDNASQSSDSTNNKRAIEDLAARADFKPVWNQLKALGNNHFHPEGAAAEKRDGLETVWSSFRDMVDQGYESGLDRRSPSPMPSPKVDTTAFSHAAAQFIKQSVFQHHDRRDAGQFQPLLNAAGSFAKEQMQEWTEALNDYSSKHGKSH